MFRQMKINRLSKKLREGKSLQEKMEAARILGEMGCPDMVDWFIRRLDPSYYDHDRLEAVYILGEFGDAHSIVWLIGALGDDNKDVRMGAAHALEQLGEPQWKRSVIRGDPDDYARLGRSGDFRASIPLFRALARPPGTGFRSEAARAVGALGDPDAIEALISVLGDIDADLRAIATESLGRLGRNSEATVGALVGRLKDPSPRVRIAAIAALEVLVASQAREPLAHTLVDKVGEVRATAARTMAKLNEPKWLEWVKGDDDDFRRLAQSRDPQAILLSVDAMEGKDQADQVTAARVILEQGDPMAIEALKGRAGLFMKVLGDSSPDERVAAADILGRMGVAEAVPVLVARLADPEGGVRLAAAQALDRLGESQWAEWVKGDDLDMIRLFDSHEPRIVEIIVQIFADLTGGLRAQAVEVLGRIKDPRALDLLLKALEAPGDLDRVSVIQALKTRGDARAVPAIIAHMEGLERMGLISAMEALGALSSPEAVEPLRRRLIDPDPAIRQEAARALGELGETKWLEWVGGDDEDFRRMARSDDTDSRDLMNRFLEPLHDTLKSIDVQAKGKAILRLAGLGAADSIAPLIRCLRDRHPEIRKAAFDAFLVGDFPTADVATRLVDSLTGEDPDAPGRKEALELMGRLGREHFLGPLSEMLNYESPCACVAAARFLGRLRDSRAVEPLIQVLGRASYHPIAIAVVDALGELGDMRAVDPLLNKLSKWRLDTRAAVAHALGKLGDSRAIEPLIACLTDPDVNVRSSAARALGKLGEHQWVDVIQGDEKDFERLGGSGDQRLLGPLVDLLISENPLERKMGAAGLPGLGHPQWASCILGDTEDFTRMGATQDIRALELLEKVLKKSTSSYHIGPAAKGLSKLGHPGVIQPLAETLLRRDVDDLSHILVAEALCEVGDARGFEPLIQGLSYTSKTSPFQWWDTRIRAAHALISLYQRDKLTDAQKSRLRAQAPAIRKRHSETVHTPSSDCTTPFHQDNGGIGLDF
jgi:HEAT repeat protein